MKNFWTNFKAEFSLPRIAFLVVAAMIIVPPIIWLIKKVPGVKPALEKIPGAGAPMALLLALLAFGMASPSFAADTSPFAREFTSLVVKQGLTEDSLTNSFRVYDATGTNCFLVNSNAALIYQNGGVSNYTAITTSIVVSNAIGGPRTLFFKNGLLISTNY